MQDNHETYFKCSLQLGDMQNPLSWSHFCPSVCLSHKILSAMLGRRHMFLFIKNPFLVIDLLILTATIPETLY